MISLQVNNGHRLTSAVRVGKFSSSSILLPAPDSKPPALGPMASTRRGTAVVQSFRRLRRPVIFACACLAACGPSRVVVPLAALRPSARATIPPASSARAAANTSSFPQYHARRIHGRTRPPLSFLQSHNHSDQSLVQELSMLGETKEDLRDSTSSSSSSSWVIKAYLEEDVEDLAGCFKNDKDLLERLKDYLISLRIIISTNGADFDAKVAKLVELGFDRQAAVHALRLFNGNEEQAASFLFGG
ncbi:hypothetical protein AXF42_Ash014708 [Apostasia shenzhenica]|uniref:UBA domain-containing protein n=1 Tax=Apostasia shenzhenica TaxID=1088818 RepID=A0A2H9ZW71_9ASPA|nr:hypothetical protein AXF42_Ash014708 [Apostasia shenzhenica]